MRLGLLLSEVGRLNNIEVSQEEVNQALMQEAQRHPGQEREVFEFFQRTPEAMANLRAPIYEDKAIDFIADLAQIDVRDVSPEALREEVENEAEDAEKKKPAKKTAAKKAAKPKAGKKAKKDAEAADGDEAPE